MLAGVVLVEAGEKSLNGFDSCWLWFGDGLELERLVCFGRSVSIGGTSTGLVGLFESAGKSGWSRCTILMGGM